MNMRKRIQDLVVLVAVVAGVIGGTAILGTPARAAKCCKVMVCAPYGCWEECRACPKFP